MQFLKQSFLTRSYHYDPVPSANSETLQNERKQYQYRKLGLLD